MYGNFHKLSNNIIKKTIYKLTFFHNFFCFLIFVIHLPLETTLFIIINLNF